jgi:hypothetical protein
VNVGDKVALYNGEGGRGVVVETSDGTSLVHFTDGAKIWCGNRNLTRLEAKP